MKSFLVALVALSLSAQAGEKHPQHEEHLHESPVLHSSIEALKAFKSLPAVDPSLPLVGFDSREHGQKVEVMLLTGATQLGRLPFMCTTPESCQTTGLSINTPYQPGALSLSLQEFELAADSIIEALEAEVSRRPWAQLDLLKEVMMWQSEGRIEMQLRFTTHEELPDRIAYAWCHLHGEHFDCHFKSRPGPNQPEQQ